VLKYVISYTQTLQLLVVNLTYCISHILEDGQNIIKCLHILDERSKSSLGKIKKEDAQDERDWWHGQLSHL